MSIRDYDKSLEAENAGMLRQKNRSYQDFLEMQRRANKKYQQMEAEAREEVERKAKEAKKFKKATGEE
jgi:hypothetical protein